MTTHSPEGAAERRVGLGPPFSSSREASTFSAQPAADGTKNIARTANTPLVGQAPPYGRCMGLFTAMLLALFALPGCNRDKSKPGGNPPTLNLYIWAEYIAPSVLEKFTARTGIKVSVDIYDSNETLLTKLQSGVASYDLCVPTEYMVRILHTQGLVQPIDHAKVPNLANIDKQFLNRNFDPGNKFSIPYLWGTTGLGYNKLRVKEPVESWKILFDAKYAGQILMLDDMRECFAVALKSMGKSLNTTDPATLRQAADLLKAQKKLVKTYNSNDYDNILKSGDVIFAHGFNGQIAKLALAEPAKFAYVIPREGATVTMDGLCIPAKAKNVEAALAFINFIHEPEINAEIVNYVTYASANEAAKKYIRPAILNNPWVYPPPAALTHCEFMEDPGPAMELLDRLWTEIKAE